MRSTPIATGRKEPREAERGLAQRRKRMPLPFQGAGQGTAPPRFTDRCGKLAESLGNSSRFGGKERRGVGSPAGLLRSGISSGQKKKIPRPAGRFRNRLYNLDDIIGAFITDVERQSISNRHKYLQAIADLEIVSFI